MIALDEINRGAPGAARMPRAFAGASRPPVSRPPDTRVAAGTDRHAANYRITSEQSWQRAFARSSSLRVVGVESAGLHRGWTSRNGWRNVRRPPKDLGVAPAGDQPDESQKCRAASQWKGTWRSWSWNSSRVRRSRISSGASD